LFADTQTVTVNAVAQSLVRVGTSANAGTFAKDDETYKLTISQEKGKLKNRRMIKLDFSKISPDPLFPAQNTPYDMSVHTVVSEPPVGFTNAEIKLIVDGFLAFLSASGGAAITKLLGGEI
jgi:hypothetical protein